MVVTNQPLRKVLHNSKASGCLAAWAIELRQFDISYKPRNSIKWQILADFAIECSFRPHEENTSQAEQMINAHTPLA